MNTAQAKAESLPDFLGRLGYQPAHIRGNDLWYRSPFRPEERTPSFKIDRAKNVWFDHGLGAGGTLIDFVAHLNGTQDISRVLADIAQILDQAPRAPIIAPGRSARPASEPPVIDGVGAIADQGLERYLGERAIPLDLARLYLKEVAYRIGEHRYRALAFPNDAGGYEVRSPRFKGTLGRKEITYLTGERPREAAVFEGFFDFLSVLTHYRRERPSANVLVLNSLGLMERGIARLDGEHIERVHAYLDRDEPGRGGLTTLAGCEKWRVEDGSGLYAGYKDANEYLVAARGALVP